MNFARLVTKEWQTMLMDLLNGLGEPATVTDHRQTLLAGSVTGKASHEIPIKVRGRTLGWVQGGQKAHVVAGVLSTLVEKEWDKRDLLDKVAEHEDELALMREVSEKAAESLDVARIAAHIVDEATKYIESTAASVMLADEKTGRLEVVAGFGRKFPENQRPVLKPGVGIAGHVLLSGEAEVVVDTSEDPRFVPGNYEVASLLCVPILVKGDVIGTVNVSSSRHMNYRENDLRLVKILTLAAGPILYAARTSTVSIMDVPPELSGIAEPAGEGEMRPFKKTMAVMYAGLRSFAEISRSMDPSRCLSLLNEYFGLVRAAAGNHGGAMGQMVGDTAGVFFPDEDGKGAAKALAAALEVVAEVRRWAEKRGTSLAVGVGLDYGKILGGGPAVDGACVYLGDPVAGASRLERLAKTYGLQVAASEKFIRATDRKHDRVREIDTVAVPGVSENLVIYDVFAADEEKKAAAKEKWAREYAKALRLYRNREFAEAGELFHKLRQQMPFDTASKLLLARCNAFQKISPPGAWVGVTTMPGR
ncbi:MAG: GAF domain-containing protein [Deltaproteobacteria bacterium]|nr:GAF domain-containing protein [Deltaproteobacteria bacterium]